MINSEQLNVNDITKSLQQFSWPDYLVFTLMLIVCILIGIYFGFFEKKFKFSNKNDNNNDEYQRSYNEEKYEQRRRASAALDYLVGGRQMKVIPIAMSLVASWISGISILGTATEMYLYGTKYIFIIIITFFSTIVMSYVYLPIFHELQLTSAYEYLELRFDKRMRLLGSIVFMFGTIFWSPICMYVPAIAFNQVTGVNIHIVTPIVCIICIFYTCVGGIKAVVWTDVIQGIIMYGTIIFIVIKGTINVGGINVVIKRNFDSERFEIPELTLDPTIRHSVLSLTVGGFIYWIQTNAGNQSMIQRYLALPTLKHARYALLIYTISVMLMLCLCAYSGLLIYANFYDCDPLSTKLAKAKDQLLPLYAMHIFKGIPGLAGLFVAAVFSAALSSLSTSLNSLAAIVLEDFIKPYISRPLSEKQTHYIMRTVVCAFGVLCVSLVFVVEHLGTVLQLSMSLSGILIGPLFGAFAMGIFLPWIKGSSALTGCITGICCMSWICLKAQADIAMKILTFQYKHLSTEGCTYAFKENLTFTSMDKTLFSNQSDLIDKSVPIHHMSYLLYGAVGFIITLIITCISTLFFGTFNACDVDPALLAPFIRRFIKPRKSLSIRPDIKEMNCIIHAFDEVKDNQIN